MNTRPDKDISQHILTRCSQLGFTLAGIAPTEPTSYASEFRQWLAAGRHGEMEYLKRHEDLLVDPTRLVDGARSIISVADRYWAGETDSADEADSDGSTTAPTGRIARYARGDDYHQLIKKRLHVLCDELNRLYPEHTFRACVDTAPLLEREHAQRAGLGAVGKNTLLIKRGEGSYFLLGEIVTTLELDPSEPGKPNPCGSCTRCIEACPTGAITPWSVDATRCISYLTIEHRSAVDTSFFSPSRHWMFGCDICQEVCPHNQSRSGPGQDRPSVQDAYLPRRAGFDLLDVLNWAEEDRRAAFAKSAMKRARLDMMKRNALIAAGNAMSERNHPALLKRITAMAADAAEPGLVRQTAAAVLANLPEESP